MQDILDLPATEEGKAVIADREDDVWRVLAEAGLPAVARPHYDFFLRRRFLELRKDAAGALGRGEWDKWEYYWGLIGELRGTDSAARARDFVDVQRQARGQAQRIAAVKLLRQWQALGVGAKLPGEVERLLAAETAEELDRLLAGALPAARVALVLRLALARAEIRAHAAATLRAAEPELLHAFCRELAPGVPVEQQVDWLKAVVLVEGRVQGSVVERLLSENAKLAAATVDGLLSAVDAYGPKWDAYWSKSGRLVRLFEALSDAAPSRQRLWQQYTNRLTVQVLHDDAAQVGILGQLIALQRQGMEPPSACRPTLKQWQLLRDLLTRPEELAATSGAEVEDTLKRRGIKEPDALLRERFVRLRPDKVAAQLDGFLQTFRLIYQTLVRSARYEAQEEAFQTWLKVTAGGNDAERQKHCQAAYLLQMENHLFAVQLAQENRQRLAPGLLSYLEAELRKQGPTSKSGEQQAVPDEDEALPSRRAQRWLAENKWVILGGGTLLLAVAVMIFMLLGGRGGDADGEPPQRKLLPDKQGADSRKSGAATGKAGDAAKKIPDQAARGKAAEMPAAVNPFDPEATEKLARALRSIPDGFVQPSWPGFNLPSREQVQRLEARLNDLSALLRDAKALQDPKAASARLAALADNILQASEQMKAAAAVLKAPTEQGDRLRLAVELWALGQRELGQDMGVWEVWCVRHLRKKIENLSTQEPRIRLEWPAINEALGKLGGQSGAKNVDPFKLREVIPDICTFVAADVFHQRTDINAKDYQESRKARWEKFGADLKKRIAP